MERVAISERNVFMRLQVGKHLLMKQYHLLRIHSEQKLLHKMKEYSIVMLSIVIIISSESLNAQTWEKIEMNFPQDDTLLDVSKICFATRNTGWIFSSGVYSNTLQSKIFKTTDGGKYWSIQYKGNSFLHVSLFTTDSLHCWGVDNGLLENSGTLLFTSDGGETWDSTSISSKEKIDYFTSLYFFNTQTGIAFNNPSWFTSDGGKNWIKGNDSTINFSLLTKVYFINNKLGWAVSEWSPFATDGGFIVNTIDGGKTWKYQDTLSARMYGVDFVDSLKGFAVGTNWNFSTWFLYSTINGGEDWQYKQYFTTGPFWDIGFFDHKNGWITSVGKIFKTTDEGKTWNTQMLEFQSELRKLIILKKDKVAYAFGDNHYQTPFTLLRADLNDLTVVTNNNENFPVEFQLDQNYPNPFNPTTTIRYQLPIKNIVTLKVYDVLGREIAVLVNEQQDAGTYSAQWNASQFSSGIYVAVMRAGSFTAAKKLLMLK